MARKQKHEEHENHERWLVSYADFITLLFAFFVVMYSLSSVNEGKYRVLSDALIAAFKSSPKSLDPIQVGDPIRAPQEAKQEIAPAMIEAVRMPIRQRMVTKKGAEGEGAGDKEKLTSISSKLEKALAGLILKDLVKLNKKGDWLEVEINSSILFSSGGALLQPSALPVLTEVADILAKYPNAIRVEGFTDNIPIETQLFPSNWELSAGRAASVVHLLSDEGVDPFQLQAVGFGEHRPVADNSTAEGRNRNRRVVIVILAQTAKELYDNENLFKIPDVPEPPSDIDLDVPIDVVEIPVVEDKEALPVPENMPENLPLKTRDNKPSSEGQDGLKSILESIGFPGSENEGSE